MVSEVDVERFIKVIELFKLKKSEKERWTVHSRDIVIDQQKWREIKRELREMTMILCYACKKNKGVHPTNKKQLLCETCYKKKLYAQNKKVAKSFWSEEK